MTFQVSMPHDGVRVIHALKKRGRVRGAVWIIPAILATLDTETI